MQTAQKRGDSHPSGARCVSRILIGNTFGYRVFPLLNFKAAQETLRQKGIEFEFQDHKIVHSIYFYDPDGHLLELTTYELSD